MKCNDASWRIKFCNPEIINQLRWLLWFIFSFHLCSTTPVKVRRSSSLIAEAGAWEKGSEAIEMWSRIVKGLARCIWLYEPDVTQGGGTPQIRVREQDEAFFLAGAGQWRAFYRNYLRESEGRRMYLALLLSRTVRSVTQTQPRGAAHRLDR